MAHDWRMRRGGRRRHGGERLARERRPVWAGARGEEREGERGWNPPTARGGGAGEGARSGGDGDERRGLGEGSLEREAVGEGRVVGEVRLGELERELVERRLGRPRRVAEGEQVQRCGQRAAPLLTRRRLEQRRGQLALGHQRPRRGRGRKDGSRRRGGGREDRGEVHDQEAELQLLAAGFGGGVLEAVERLLERLGGLLLRPQLLAQRRQPRRNLRARRLWRKAEPGRLSRCRRIAAAGFVVARGAVAAARQGGAPGDERGQAQPLRRRRGRLCWPRPLARDGLCEGGRFAAEGRVRPDVVGGDLVEGVGVERARERGVARVPKVLWDDVAREPLRVADPARLAVLRPADAVMAGRDHLVEAGAEGRDEGHYWLQSSAPLLAAADPGSDQ
mmetsp:Transcript_21264/g.66565  ORF Transcript_21264/g.66565 Transcript_21264/m.66565 type:complete len:391 (+) Transcript_21264:317-1489(+)